MRRLLLRHQVFRSCPSAIAVDGQMTTRQVAPPVGCDQRDHQVGDEMRRRMGRHIPTADCRSIGGVVLVANSYSDCHSPRISACSTRASPGFSSRYGSCVVCWTLPVSSRRGDVGVWPPKPTSTRNSCGRRGRHAEQRVGLRWHRCARRIRPDHPGRESAHTETQFSQHVTHQAVVLVAVTATAPVNQLVDQCLWTQVVHRHTQQRIEVLDAMARVCAVIKSCRTSMVGSAAPS